MRQLFTRRARPAANLIVGTRRTPTGIVVDGSSANSERLAYVRRSEPAGKPCLGRSTIVQTKFTMAVAMQSMPKIMRDHDWVENTWSRSFILTS